MEKMLLRINFAVRRLICWCFGHVEQHVSLSSVGLKQCRRCLRITDQKTVRRRVTYGEVERRMRDNPPHGYSFVDCNWKKRKAKFVAPNGAFKFVMF